MAFCPGDSRWYWGGAGRLAGGSRQNCDCREGEREKNDQGSTSELQIQSFFFFPPNPELKFETTRSSSLSLPSPPGGVCAGGGQVRRGRGPLMAHDGSRAGVD